MSMLLFILAGFVFVGSAILAIKSRTGEQETLGAVGAMIALLIAAIGALARVAGY